MRAAAYTDRYSIIEQRGSAMRWVFRCFKVRVASLALVGVFATTAQAAEVRVAVAANFTAPMRQIAQAFERDTGHKAVLSFGATGAFYAQIRNGAPFDVFLSADDTTPARLVSEGAGVTGNSFPYAYGRLMLWSATPGVVDERGDVLKSGNFERLALANPRVAPYGAAAVQTMERLGVAEALKARWVQGENIAQVHQFVSSGNAALGFVALSQVWLDGQLTSGSGWLVPANLHEPIRQDAVLLKRGQGNPAALALMHYLKSEPAQRIVRQFGYDLGR